ncbi:MAG: dTMP kinase [Chloroflexota bacterium]|jgi:dTMP kinase|nr:dTMP kinase [Chloroflexota bacterium]
MFITLEGPEGSGKTSQMPALAEYLRNAGYDVVATREPGGTAVGDQIREVLMNLKNVEIVPRTEILLFLAARAQHVEGLIRPSLQAGKVVLCDRFSDSTLAYQGYGHQTDLDVLRSLLDFATGGLKPDLTLLLDVPVLSGLERKRENSAEWNRLDAYAEAFHTRVRLGYQALAQAEPNRWVTIDATQDKESVQEEMRQVVLERLQRR